MLYKKARADSAFSEKIDKAARRIIDYKISCGFLSVKLADDGKYLVTINYPEFTGQDFDKAREENIKLYVENF